MDYASGEERKYARNISMEHFTRHRLIANQSLSMRQVGVVEQERVDALRKRGRFLASLGHHARGRKMETIPMIKAPWLNPPVDALEYRHLTTIVGDYSRF